VERIWPARLGGEIGKDAEGRSQEICRGGKGKKEKLLLAHEGVVTAGPAQRWGYWLSMGEGKTIRILSTFAGGEGKGLSTRRCSRTGSISITDVEPATPRRGVRPNTNRLKSTKKGRLCPSAQRTQCRGREYPPLAPTKGRVILGCAEEDIT